MRTCLCVGGAICLEAKMQFTEYDIARFWSHVNKSGECWTWNMSHDGHGYGHFCVNAKIERAHRVSYAITYGRIPESLEICHKCDNPGCVRPDHLFAGTHSDNMQDCAQKGHNMLQRHPELRYGERHPLAKLTESDVKTIRQFSDLGSTLLARRFHISRWMIRRILSGLAWKHI